MRLLIIDCTRDADSWGAEDFRRILAQVPGLEIHVRRAPEDDLPLVNANYDRIMITGSRTSCLDESDWVVRMLDYLKVHLEKNTPILGVCFGHQMLCRLLGGKKVLGESSVPEYGWTRVEILGESPLFRGLPKSFHSLSSHREEVVSLPSGLKLLAKSKDCANQAFASESRPLFGIQFHPEKDLESAQSSYESLKKNKKQHLFQNRNNSKKLYDPKIGEKIFLNFITYENS